MAKKKKTAKAKKQDFSNNPFNHLKGFAISEQEKAESTLPVAESVPNKVFGSFSDEMKMLGVERLNQAGLIEETELDLSAAEQEISDPDEDLSEEALFLAAMGDLTVTFEDSFITERPPSGTMPRRVKQLKMGKLTPAASLDLHGLQCAEVVDKLENFLRNGQHHGWKTLLVITGKGLHSENGESVLRNEVERYLADEGRQHVVEWSRAPRQYGGDGALVLFLSQK